MPACRLNQAVLIAGLFRQIPRASDWPGRHMDGRPNPVPRRSGNPVGAPRSLLTRDGSGHEFRDSDRDLGGLWGVCVNRWEPRLSTSGRAVFTNLFVPTSYTTRQPGQANPDMFFLPESFGSPGGTTKGTKSFRQSGRAEWPGPVVFRMRLFQQCHPHRLTEIIRLQPVEVHARRNQFPGVISPLPDNLIATGTNHPAAYERLHQAA